MWVQSLRVSEPANPYSAESGKRVFSNTRCSAAVYACHSCRLGWQIGAHVTQ